MNRSLWKLANPALGSLLSLDDMITDSEHPDRIAFLRSSLNMFVAADSAWLQPGQWDKGLTTGDFPVGQSWLAVDSSLDDSRYVGVLASADPQGYTHVKTGFVCNTLAEMQEKIVELMGDPLMKLAITPTLEAHIAPYLDKRKIVVGYGELLKYTGLVKNLIVEGRLRHSGEVALTEHMNRAVAIKQQHAFALSSKRSPGAIELARCCVFASALASRPRAVGKAAMGFSS